MLAGITQTGAPQQKHNGLGVGQGGSGGMQRNSLLRQRKVKCGVVALEVEAGDAAARPRVATNAVRNVALTCIVMKV